MEETLEESVLRRVSILLLVGFGVWITWKLSATLAPFIAAFLLAYLLNPLVDKLAKRIKVRRGFSIGLVFFTMFGALSAAALWLIPVLWDQVTYAKEHIGDVTSWMNLHMRPWLRENLNIRTGLIDPDAITKMIVDKLQEHFKVADKQSVLANFFHSGLNIINIALMVVLVPVVAFYFLLDWYKMTAQIRTLIPRRYEPAVVRIALECHEVLGAFVKGQLLVMLILGVIYALGLQLTGLKLGLIIGIVAGLASIIPYLGFITGIIAAVVACFFQFGMDWTQLGLIGLVFFIGHMTEGYVLQPFLLGDKIGLSPVAVIFAVLAGADLMGFAGMLLALPLAAVIVVCLRHLFSTYAGSIFYQRRPPEMCSIDDAPVILDAPTPLPADITHKDTI